MKGKGKGDRSEVKDVIQFPQLSTVDHVKQCPRFTSVLNREGDSGVMVEELNTLQVEMETMLSSVAKRMQQLHSEIELLCTPETKSPGKKIESKGKDVRGKGVGESSPSKRGSGKGHDDKPSKKMKLDEAPSTPGKRASSKPDKPESTKKSKETPVKEAKTRGAKGKNLPPEPVVPPVIDVPTPPPPPPVKSDAPVRAAKNDAPNRFWALVEPYCTEISTEDLKVLEDIMRSHEDDVDYYKIPPLGKHYADKWAHEDMLEEQRQNNKLNDKRRSSSTGSSESTDTRKSRDSDSDSPYGPLTQRLVQALIEENIMAPLDDACISEADAAEAATISPRSLAKQLNMGNAASLERKIKRELELEGILDSDDKSHADTDDANDEVLAELKKKQAELKAISQHNMTVTKRLYKLAKEEMARQDIRKRIIVADAEVMDAYRKIQQTRVKKKAPTKKEIDSVRRALREREALVKQLDNS